MENIISELEIKVSVVSRWLIRQRGKQTLGAAERPQGPGGVCSTRVRELLHLGEPGLGPCSPEPSDAQHPRARRVFPAGVSPRGHWFVPRGERCPRRSVPAPSPPGTAGWDVPVRAGQSGLWPRCRPLPGLAVPGSPIPALPSPAPRRGAQASGGCRPASLRSRRGREGASRWRH